MLKFLWKHGAICICLPIVFFSFAVLSVSASEQDDLDPAVFKKMLKDAKHAYFRHELIHAENIIDQVISGAQGSLYEAKAHCLRALHGCSDDVECAIGELQRALELDVLSASLEYQVHLDLICLEIQCMEEARAEERLSYIETFYLGETGLVHNASGNFMSEDRAQLLLAEALWRCGWVRKSLEHAQVSAGSGNTYQQESALLASRALCALNRIDEAIEILESAVGDLAQSKRGAKTSHIYSALVELALRQGDEIAAKRYVKKGAQHLAGTRDEMDFLFKAGSEMRQQYVNGWQNLYEQVAASNEKGLRVAALEVLASDAGKYEDWERVALLARRLAELPERSPEQQVDDWVRAVEAELASGKDARESLDGMLLLLDNQLQRHGASECTRSLYRAGKALVAAGDAEGAMELYQFAVESSMDDEWSLRAQIQLAELLASRGATDEAIEAFSGYVATQHAKGNRQEVINGFIKMFDVMGEETGNHLPEGLEEIVSYNLSLIESPKTLTYLVVFLQNRGYDVLAQECLGRAIQLTDAAAQLGHTPVPRMVEVEEKILRRLSELGMFEDLVERANSADPSALKNTDIPDMIRADYSYHVACGLWESGRKQEAREVFDALLAEVKDDKRLYPGNATNIGLLLMDQGDEEAALPLFKEALSTDSKNMYSNIARLYLAADSLKQGDLEGAQNQAQAVLSMAGPDEPVRWHRELYWSARYLQGLLLKEEGKVEQGEALMEEAKSHGQIYGHFSRFD